MDLPARSPMIAVTTTSMFDWGGRMAVGERKRTANSAKLLVMLLANSRRIIKTAMVQLSCRCGHARRRVLLPKDAAVSNACGTGKDVLIFLRMILGSVPCVATAQLNFYTKNTRIAR